MNPHKLPTGVSFYTMDPFLAMSVAARKGLRVDRYAGGQYLPGMNVAGTTFWGYVTSTILLI